MSKYIMAVQSRAKEGRDDEYNDWYDNAHFHEICAIPGVLSGRRFEAAPVAIGNPGLKYLAIYELEIDEPGLFLAEMGKRSADGAMSQCDALDPEASILWFYKQR